jgi:F0F1-type ATP synthase assembly protein I
MIEWVVVLHLILSLWITWKLWVISGVLGSLLSLLAEEV